MRAWAGSGTAAASPIAQTLSWPLTRMVASTSMRPCSVSGSPSSFTTAGGFTPAVQQTVRVGTCSPVESVAERSSMRSRRVPVRSSMPRARSSRDANSARLAGISGMIWSSASTRIQRVPAPRQRGYFSIVSFT